MDRLAEHLGEHSARGLAHAVGQAVGSGVFAPGQRLPPIRTVASVLGLSPTTVSAAWVLLARAGTIHTDGRRGTVIVAARPGRPTRYRRALEGHTRFPVDLSTGVPDPALLPDVRPTLRRLRATASPGSYLDEPVLPELLDVLHGDWPFAAEQITVTDGAMDAIDQALAGRVRFGERVVVEHPCFPPLLDLLETLGAHTVGVPVDHEGLLPDRLAEALRAPAAAVILQPRAHNPTGASLSTQRAADLAGVLRGRDLLIIEDDSAGAIASAAPVSLGRWLPDRVLHVRSYSKSHGPDLRLATLGGPRALVEPIVERRLLGQGWTSRLLQRILLDLLTDPDSVAAVRAARREYARRRRLVTTALRRRDIDLPDGDGINLWLPVHDEPSALLSLASHGIAAAAGSPFELLPDSTPHLRITVGLIAERPAEIAGHLATAATAGVRGVRR